ncbi:HAMP domain-containing histidine kinase [Nocardioides guangzhouensis]|uniref:histidine kinase n=1 Tax=Nocardioides guangzhouensis TaxID=2497878 RepID=A0A4Q4Z6G2_9ACTN|nr:histidine kinase dimerization/phospho-acceptor domain-containing protein [Nocardioides guangzhouensis]RYP82626.1 HAMP domain-containing histidine kinase [Nocardioides guangzhouensis]
MRRRLAAAFVLLALVLLVTVGVVRAFSVRDMIHDEESAELGRQARLIATRVDERLADGEPVDAAYLDDLVPADTQLVYETDDASVVVNGTGFGAADGEDAMSARAATSQGTVTVIQSEAVLGDILGRNLGSLVVLMVVMCLIATVVGIIAADMLTRPFRKLADAAGALSRGRYDLELPHSSMPEVTAINDALVRSASQLQHSIRRDREFLQHASHVLRTPIAGVRLELEELAGRPGLREDVREAVLHSASEMEKLNGVVDQLLADSRNRPLVAGSEIDLQSLATAIGHRWREGVPEDTSVRVYVDGGAEEVLTPGPVEQLLDHLLADVQALDPREVSLRFSGQGNYVRIRVCGADASSAGGDAGALARALSVTEAMGGRINGDVMAERGIEILLPRR